MLSVRGFVFFGLFVLATLIGVMVVERASQVFALLGAAVTAAVIGAPFVRTLSRWMPRGAAIVAITLIGMFGTVAVLGTVAWDLNRQASELSDSLHHAVADLPADSSAAHTAEDLELDDRIDRVFDGAATRLVAGSNDPLAVAGGIAKVVVVGVLAAFIIAGGRRVVGMGIRFVRRTSIREQLHVAVATSIMRAGAYLRRMIAVSVGHGAVAALVALALGLPGSITIAAWVAVASTVPILGGLLAWLPVIALAKVNDVPLSLAIGIALLCIVGDRLARARWVHRALRVGPLIALVGIGVGLTLIGISGSILGLFVVALVSALLSHAAHFRAALSDLIEDPSDRLIPDANDLAPLEEPVMAEPRGTETYIRLRLSSRTAITAAVAATLAMALFEIGPNHAVTDRVVHRRGIHRHRSRPPDLEDAPQLEAAALRRHDRGARAAGRCGQRCRRSRRAVDHELGRNRRQAGTRSGAIDGDAAAGRTAAGTQRRARQGGELPRDTARSAPRFQRGRARGECCRRRCRRRVLDDQLHAGDPVGRPALGAGCA